MRLLQKKKTAAVAQLPFGLLNGSCKEVATIKKLKPRIINEIPLKRLTKFISKEQCPEVINFNVKRTTINV